LDQLELIEFVVAVLAVKLAHKLAYKFRMGKRKNQTVSTDMISLDTSVNPDVVTKDTGSLPGVVYVGHIPKNFEEKEIRGFFEQFGEILRVRLSRSKKTAQSKGYAFVQFVDADVAKIVADTMNDYILCGRLLKCQFIPNNRIHKDTFKGANKHFKKIDWQAKAKEQRNRVKTAEEHQKSVLRLLKKDKLRRRKIAALGIDYDFPGYALVAPKSQKKTQFADDEEEMETTEVTMETAE